MAKNRSPSELNSKTIRIGIGDYALLAEISRRAGVTFAEALHLALVQQEPEREPEREPEKVTRVSPAQIPMPAFRVAPVVTSIAVNGAGAKHSAFAIKPKGGIKYG